MRNPLDEKCLDLAWGQWTALGVRGVLDHNRNHAIDVEALLLFTATLADADPRLYGEALDWSVQFGASHISVTRLRRLYKRLPVEQREAFSEFAGAVHQHAAFGWPDPRPPTRRHKLSGKSRLPMTFEDPALLQLRARRLIGISARVEILIGTMTSHENATWSAAELAHLGYAKQNVAAVLEDLVAAGTMERTRRGNQHRYRLLRRKELRALFAPMPYVFPLWLAQFPALAGLRAALARTAKQPEVVKDVELANELSRHLPALRELGYSDAFVPIAGASANEIISWAMENLGNGEPACWL